MKNDELFYYLSLQSVVGIGPITAKKLLNHFGGAREMFQAKKHELKRIKGLGSEVLQQIGHPINYKKAEKEMRFIEANAIQALTFEDQDYPSKLKHCQDAPIVIFKKGDFDINNRKVISIVGTRMMTPYGSQFLKDFIKEIKRFDPVIVSGLAYGIDICAHQESLINDICTVGILAHGLDRIYPKSHRGIAGKMLNKGGLLTEFWSGCSPERENFVKRNRIIAGLSEATLVVESANKGGSLITAELAFSYHRDVFALPGRTTDNFSKGCNMLIKSNKAAMITTVKDLEYVLGWTSNPLKTKKVQQKLFTELNEEEKKVYNFLEGSEKMLLDRLALETGQSVQKTLMLLLLLELKGMVISLSLIHI